MCYIAILVVVAILTSSHAAPTRKCAGGYEDGQTIDVGRYWYVCQDGTMVEKGCLSETRRRLIADQTFKRDGYVMACVLDSNGSYKFSYKGCVSERDQEYLPNETWQNENYWYKCATDGNRVKSEIHGCVDDDKRFNVSKMYFWCSHIKYFISFF